MVVHLVSSLGSIHALNKKLNIIYIDSNIGVIFFKPVQIIGWWNDTESFMIRNLFILESITDIQNYGSESIHIRYINIDS